MPPIDLIAFDADDTLWHNESLYEDATQRFLSAFAPAHEPQEVRRLLDATEHRNIPLYGYGIKSFMLSMMETAHQLSAPADLPARIELVVAIGKGMLRTKTKVFPHVRRVLDTLDERFALMLITKGDLIDQRAKLEASGLKKYFKRVEIVAEKSAGMYRALMKDEHVLPQNFVMVGNSLRSDIAPVLETGGQAVHIPYHLCWVHEQIEITPAQKALYHEITSIKQLPALINQIEEQETYP